MNRQLTRMLRQMRAALVVLLFAPFLALQTLAQGTMPSSGPDGLTMVLCTGESMIEVVLLEDGSIAPVEDSHAGLSCPWAVSHAPAVTPDLPVVAAYVALENAVDVPTGQVIARIAALAPVPPARGPPGLV